MKVAPDSSNDQLLCFHCKKPIKSRKDFGMGIVRFGFSLSPFHILCWNEFGSNASMAQKLVMTPALKLTAKDKNVFKISKIELAVIVGSMLIVFFLPIQENFLLAFIYGIIFIPAFWSILLVNTQNYQWRKAIALIPEEDT